MVTFLKIAKQVSFFFLFFFIALSLNKTVLAQSVECKLTSSTDSGEIQKVIEACNDKLGKLRGERNTLASEIKYMDTQQYLTQLEVNKSENQIIELRKEVKNLDARIGEIDETVDKVSLVVNKKIGQMYKKQKTGSFYALADVNNLPQFLRSIQYLQKSQENDRHLMIRLQNSKVTFKEQRSLREVKEDELQNLLVELEQHQIDLANQRQVKKNLLTITQNDERKYQQILAEAKAQIAGFKSFSASTNTGIIAADSLGVGYDGTYYSQRDQRWALATIGDSPETIKEVGCLLTSVAMALRAKGVDVNPLSIAGNGSYFWLDTAYMLYRSQLSLPGGKTGKSIGISEISNYLSNNEAVIVGLNAGGYGTHFIVLKKIEGSDYIMFDPIYGPDKKFTDHYSTGQIFSAEIII